MSIVCLNNGSKGAVTNNCRSMQFAKLLVKKYQFCIAAVISMRISSNASPRNPPAATAAVARVKWSTWWH